MGVTAARQYSDSSTTAILVQGMYASGTSLLSCVISLLTQARPGEAADPDDDPFPHLIQGGAVAGLNRRVLRGARRHRGPRQDGVGGHAVDPPGDP